MRASILKQVTILLILAGGFYSCTTNNDINMDDIDFSNIENLYEQPLPVIKKCVEGKWKWYVQFGGVVGTSYPENTFVDIKDDYIIIDYEDGSQRIVNYAWRSQNMILNDMKIKRWVIWNTECDQGVWYFDSIKNDTLGVGHVPSPDATFWQFSSGFARVK